MRQHLGPALVAVELAAAAGTAVTAGWLGWRAGSALLEIGLPWWALALVAAGPAGVVLRVVVEAPRAARAVRQAHHELLHRIDERWPA